MKKIEDVFVVHRAQSKTFADHDPGNVAFISNVEQDNGVIGYVEPLPGDKVFSFSAIAVSALSGATVQLPPFVPRGGAGSGLLVLEPRSTMTAGQLAYVAAYLNLAVSWRFHWYRQLTVDRLRRLLIPDQAPVGITYALSDHIPSTTEKARPKWQAQFELFSLEALFELKPGDHHSLGSLAAGSTPVISCGDKNNGIAGYCEVEAPYRGKLTIALNGSVLGTKYHPYWFAAKDDVAICIPRQALRITTLLFIQMMLNLERWRYSYYRKCYMSKLKRFQVMLPVRDGSVDEDLMERLVTTAPYWDFIKSRLHPLD